MYSWLITPYMQQKKAGKIHMLYVFCTGTAEVHQNLGYLYFPVSMLLYRHGSSTKWCHSTVYLYNSILNRTASMDSVSPAPLRPYVTYCSSITAYLFYAEDMKLPWSFIYCSNHSVSSWKQLPGTIPEKLQNNDNKSHKH